MEYESTYYMTRYVNPHSYIGIQPARTGNKLTHSDQAVGINHIALWARSRNEVLQCVVLERDDRTHLCANGHNVSLRASPCIYIRDDALRVTLCQPPTDAYTLNLNSTTFRDG